MGAWGHGTFENDDAMDWVAELEESGQTAIIRALKSVIDEAGDFIEAPECCAALAAAEVVAGLRGKPSASLPETVRAWLHGKPAPEAALVANAKAATEAVASDSELKDLWEEASEFETWLSTVRELQSRLA
jgi:hypothetical protein